MSKSRTEAIRFNKLWYLTLLLTILEILAIYIQKLLLTRHRRAPFVTVGSLIHISQRGWIVYTLPLKVDDALFFQRDSEFLNVVIVFYQLIFYSPYLNSIAQMAGDKMVYVLLLLTLPQRQVPKICALILSFGICAEHLHSFCRYKFLGR